LKHNCGNYRQAGRTARLGSVVRGVPVKVQWAVIEVVSRHLERLVSLHEEEQRNIASPQAEYFRGQLHDTKWLLGLFCGEQVREEVLTRVRQQTRLPLPHLVPLAPDGNSYGGDTDGG